MSIIAITWRGLIFPGLIFFITAGSCNAPAQQQKIAVITFEAEGCFGSTTSVISIFKEGKYTIASLQGKTQVDKKTVLRDSAMLYVRDFVAGLVAASDTDLCTTIQSCSILTPGESIIREHISCSWEGFAILEKKLFAKE